MLPYELVLEENEVAVARFPVEEAGILIGRSQDATISLKGPLVSRNHARVSINRDKLVVEDLDSRNGICVNGKRVPYAALNHGDSILIGDYTLIVSSINSLPTPQSVITFEAATTLCDTILDEDKKGHLLILYKTAQLLGTVFDPDELLSKILKTIFQALPARRGYIMTLDEEGNPIVRSSQSLEDKDEPPPLSMTVVQHVIKERSAILTSDAQGDKRFGDSHSVLDFAIQSAMCVPLCGRKKVEGAIYVDSGSEMETFSGSDLKLLAAIGQVAGVAVENARLYREKLEQERLAAIGQATAGVGHCIKNILTGISGGAQIVNTGLKSEDLQYVEKGWPIMMRAIERIEELVLNTLSFSRVRKPELTPSDVNGMVRDAMEAVRPRAEKHDVTLEFLAGELKLINIDVQEIFHVVLNLLTNGIDACQKKGGAITVSTTQESDSCSISVSDNGPGIPDEVLPTIFQAFVSTKGSSGTGLGLACCMKSVREYGGDITVESEEGKGAKFTVFLPEGAIVES